MADHVGEANKEFFISDDPDRHRIGENNASG